MRSFRLADRVTGCVWHHMVQVLVGEVARLEMELEAKRAEEAAAKEALEEVQGRVSEVRARFEKQMDRLRRRQNEVRESTTNSC